IVGAEVELRQKRPGVALGQARRTTERVQQGIRRGESPAVLRQLAHDDARTDLPGTVRKSQPAQQGAKERGLPRSVRPGDCDPVAPPNVEVERAQTERAAP